MNNTKKSYRIYRANKTNNGTASSWELSPKKENKYEPYNFFLVMSKQIPSDNKNAKFDWDNAITAKLGENDIGELIAVLERRKDSVGMKDSLFHQTPAGGNKVIKFNKSDNGYYLSVSSQDKDKKTNQISQNISNGEASILLVMLKASMEQLLGF